MLHLSLAVRAHPSATAPVASTNMWPPISRRKTPLWMLSETAFSRKSLQLLLRGKFMALRGSFLVSISCIVICFADEFQGEKEEWGFFHSFLSTSELLSVLGGKKKKKERNTQMSCKNLLWEIMDVTAFSSFWSRK